MFTDSERSQIEYHWITNPSEIEAARRAFSHPPIQDLLAFKSPESFYKFMGVVIEATSFQVITDAHFPKTINDLADGYATRLKAGALLAQHASISRPEYPYSLAFSNEVGDEKAYQLGCGIWISGINSRLGGFSLPQIPSRPKISGIPDAIRSAFPQGL